MKIVIIGLGSIANKHIAAIRELKPNATIIGLRSSKIANDIPLVENIYSIDEIKYIQPDFIIISNPTVLHAETILKLTEFNIPLFIEKPAIHNLKDADAIIELLNKKSIKTYVACNLRFLDCLEYTKKHLASKIVDLNEVNIYAGSYLPEWRSGKDFRSIYSANKDMGGGVHLDLIHELDYMYWLFGQPSQTYSVLRSTSALGIDAIDYANYTCLYNHYTVSVILNYYRKDYKRTMELVFSDTTWQLDLARNVVALMDGTILFQSEQTIAQTYVKQMAYFIQYLESDSKSSINDFSQGIDVLKICLNNDIKG